MSYKDAVILHKVLTDLHIGMLVLAALGGVSAFFAWRRSRWESLAKTLDSTFIGAAIFGTAFLILSMISGFVSWPWNRLWHTPMVYSKVAYAALGLNFWLIIIFVRLKYGDQVWRRANSAPMLVFTLFAFVAVLMAGSAGGHLGHGVSILDPIFSHLGVNPYLPMVLAPWWSLGSIAAGSYFVLRQFAGRKENPMTKWAYTIMFLLFVSSAGVTKLLWKEEAVKAQPGQSRLAPTHEMKAEAQRSHEYTRKIPTRSISQPAEGASVKILSPKAGQLFKGDEVPLQFKLTKGKRGEHVHAYVDGELMGMFKSEKGTLTGVKQGQHILELRVVAEDYVTELDASDRVHFMVK